MWDIKCQIQITGIRRDTINIKSTKFGVNVSEMQKSYGLSWQISTLGPEHLKSVLKSGDFFDDRNYRTPEILPEYLY